MSALSEHDLAVLDLERQWWQRPGGKDQALRDQFGLDPTRYYQQLNALIDRPEALAHAPTVVGRLRRIREKRAAIRRRLRSA